MYQKFHGSLFEVEK